jgi:hypothetical protein
MASSWLNEALASLPGILMLDCLLLGVTLRLLGLGSWYHGLDAHEQIIFRRRLGCLSSGWLWGGLVVVTDKRLIIRFGWSRVAMVNVPLTAVHSVAVSKWWWYDTARIEYWKNNRVRVIEVGGLARADEAGLLQAFRSAAVKVVDRQAPRE